MNIIFTKGIQCSGKTTWAKKEIETSSNIIRISRDDLRWMLNNYKYDMVTECLISKAVEDIICKAMYFGEDIIIDAMNLKEKDFKFTCGMIVKEYHSLCRFHVTEEGDDDFNLKELNIFIQGFPIELDVAIERCKKRESKITEEIIRDTYEKYKEVLSKIKEGRTLYYREVFSEIS